jgi:hypothetical protein
MKSNSKRAALLLSMLLTFLFIFNVQVSFSQNISQYWIANGNASGANQTPLSLGNQGGTTSVPSFQLSTSDNGTSFLNINSTRWGSAVTFTRNDPTGNQYTIMGISGNNGAGGAASLYNTSNVVTTLLNAQGNSYLTGGNVGIGTTSPQAPLEASSAPLGSSPGTIEMARISGNVGNYAQIRFLLNRYTAGNSWNSASTRIQAWTDVTGQGYIDFNPSGSPGASLAFGNGSAEYMRFLSGNVLIGKTTQTNTGYMLDVNGNSRMNEVVVNATGADFVFDPAYRLVPLNELDAYVRQQHHLPGILSAAQMQKEGLALGDNQTRQLAKIEELTLYLIEQNKKTAALEEKIKQLEARNQRLESLEQRIERLEHPQN